METAIVVYREPGGFARELRERFGLKALGVTENEVAEIVGDAEFRVKTERKPLSAADREVLKSALLSLVNASILRWYEPGRGTSARTYARRVMDIQQPKQVAIILAQNNLATLTLDAPLDGSDELSPSLIDRLADDSPSLMRCLPRCDWEMVIGFFTKEEFRIFEARLHNVSRETIRRELDYTPGAWKRVWRRFQRRAAFILDLGMGGN